MESPIAIVKSQLNLGNVVKLVIGSLIVAAIFDALGWTAYMLYPVTTLKAKFSKPAAS